MSRAEASARQIAEFEKWIDEGIRASKREHQKSHRQIHNFAERNIARLTPRVTGKSRESWESVDRINSNGASSIGSSLPHMIGLEFGGARNKTPHKMITRTIQEIRARFMGTREFGAAVGRKIFGE